MDWNLESHYTPHLAPGAAQVDAIVSVSLSGDGAGASTNGRQERVLGFIADRSGSMKGRGGWKEARNARGAAMEALNPDPTSLSSRSTSTEMWCSRPPKP